MIPFLIDKQDTSELVRDQVAAILLSEAKSQKQLAEAAGKDPSEWTFQVYLERSNPWEAFMDATTPQPPIINVTLENCNYGMSSSTITGEFISTTGLYNIDCYGHGMAADSLGAGHVAGDFASCVEAQRVARWVRNVFASGYYTYLGLRKTVHRRWIDSLNIFQPALEGRELNQIVAARLTLRVEFNEFAPQHEGEPLELVSATVKRKRTGEIYFVGEYE